MPGEFYIEARKEKISLKELLQAVAELEEKLDKLAGKDPVSDSVTAKWHSGIGTSGEAGADLLTLGADDTKHKLHSLVCTPCTLWCAHTALSGVHTLHSLVCTH